MNLEEELERLFNSSDATDENRVNPPPTLNTKGVSIDTLIDIVQKGGNVKTGIDIISKHGVLLLDKDVRIQSIKPLLIIRQNGIFEVPINQENQGGVWGRGGEEIPLSTDDQEPEEPPETEETDIVSPPSQPTVETRIREINEIKAEASVKYLKAKENIRKTIENIRKSDGFFDMNLVENTVAELCAFLNEKENAFSYMAKEIFLSDDFLLNHSINVCTISTAILKKFNAHFSGVINNHLKIYDSGNLDRKEGASAPFSYYFPEEIQDMAIGYFLHDIGKTAIPESILNKPARLTEKEFEVIKTHSFEKGMAILEKNNITNAFTRNIVRYHHAPLFLSEKSGYPLDKAPEELPPYVKICKIADIYDAMTSKRSYGDALNPIRVVTRLFRTYAQKDPLLQFILHAFVNAVGLHPPGSVVYLTNQQMAYVLDSKGPIVLPFTDADGHPLKRKANPMDVAETAGSGENLAIDSREPLISPKEVYSSLPFYLREMLFPDRPKIH